MCDLLNYNLIYVLIRHEFTLALLSYYFDRSNISLNCLISGEINVYLIITIISRHKLICCDNKVKSCPCDFCKIIRDCNL